jgi:subtilisin family serine protease
MQKKFYYFLYPLLVMLIASGCGGGGSSNPACDESPSYARASTTCGQSIDSGPIKTDGTSNPLFSSAWHLYNNGTSPFSVMGIDHNAQPVWNQGVTGAGVTVAVIDEGVMRQHEDLISNEKTGYSYNFVSKTSDPTPPIAESHGTKVAGVILATNNHLGSVGVAHQARWIGYRLDFEDADALNALAGTPPNTQNASSVIDISNNSWGETAFGGLGSAGTLYRSTIATGATQGRGGKGIVYIFSAGNSGDPRKGFTEDANYKVPQNLPQVISVAAVGSNGQLADYSTRGSVVLVSGLSLGYKNGQLLGKGITTTKPYNTTSSEKYDFNFNGTSAAAPNVSGVVALMLQANPNLTYRQVRWILAQTSRKTDTTDASWQPSALGATFSHAYGYGIADAGKAVELAKNPPILGTQKSCVIDPVNSTTITPISSSATLPSQRVFNAASCTITNIEFVEVETQFNHASFGGLSLQLTSPNGYVSILSSPHSCLLTVICNYSTATLNNNFKEWTFGSVRHMNEAPNAGNGQWIFSAYSTTNDATSRLGNTRLILWGF